MSEKLSDIMRRVNLSHVAETLDYSYRVVELFTSIEGEGVRTGRLSQFIRLANCNLRCSYCDTLYAIDSIDNPVKFQSYSLDDIIESLNRDIPCVTLTGGEPMIHQNVVPLIDAITQKGFELNLETNGAVDLMPLYDLPYRNNLIITVDYKLPSSLMEGYMLMDNFYNLLPQDVVKFVVGSLSDFDTMVEIVRLMKNHYPTSDSLPHIYIGVVWGEIEASSVVELIKQESLLYDAVFQLQIHKFIWEPNKQGV